jgi:uncharacterized protein YjbJ (UPF0337 family)
MAPRRFCRTTQVRLPEQGEIARVAIHPALITEENIMNWDRIEGDWKQFKGKVQQQWGKLTNDDIDVIEGNRTELLGVIQKRYGLAKDEAERQVDTWMKTLN